MATDEKWETAKRVEMDGRERIVKGPSKRKADDSSRRRVTKFDGRFADYSALKSSTGTVLPEVKRVLLDRKKKDRETTSHRTGIIYPSEMAKSNWCPRATYYRMSGLPEPSGSHSFTLENIFSEGNYIHSKWQSWLSDTGKLWGDWRCSRCSAYVRNSLKPSVGISGSCVGTDWVRLSPNLPPFPPDGTSYEHDWTYKEVTLSSQTRLVSGHADGALIDHNCLIEIKSLGVGTFKFDAPKLTEENTYTVNGKKILDIDGLWKNLHHPLLSHVKQGNVYLWMAEEMGLPFDSIVFIYEFKANQQVKEFQIRKSEDILNPLLDTAALIEVSLAEGIPPACPFGGCASCKDYEKERQ